MFKALHARCYCKEVNAFLLEIITFVSQYKYAVIELRKRASDLKSDQMDSQSLYAFGQCPSPLLASTGSPKF